MSDIQKKDEKLVLDQDMILEPFYYSGSADFYMPQIANKILPYIAKIKWITPNFITLFSFFLYVVGSLLIFINIPYHLYYTAILLPLSFIGDCLDGQLARLKKMSSPIGNYMDKVVDVLKIYIVTISLAIGAYINTHQVIYIFLGFTASFFFTYRYYIKLETVFSQCNRDDQYLKKCAERKKEIYSSIKKRYDRLSKSFIGYIKLYLIKYKYIFLLDEEEFVTLTALAALFNLIELWLWVLAIGQVLIAFWRLFERGYQTHKAKYMLLDPMRK